MFPRPPIDGEFDVHNTPRMALRRKVTRVGGSLGVLIPGDIVEAMVVAAGSPVRLTLVGRQMVVEPTDDALEDGAFRRAFASVLRRHGRSFERLAAFDRGEFKPRPRPKRKAK